MATTKKKVGIHNIHEYVTATPTTVTDPLGQVTIVNPKDVKPGSYYCYLCVNFDEEVKTNTHVGHSTAPPVKVKLMNLDKDPSGETEHWTLVQMVGPFVDNIRAKMFRELWKFKSRGPASRLSRGVFLAREFNRKLRDIGISPGTPAWGFHVECFDLCNEDEQKQKGGLVSQLDTSKRRGIHLANSKRAEKRQKVNTDSKQITETDQMNQDMKDLNISSDPPIT